MWEARQFSDRVSRRGLLCLASAALVVAAAPAFAQAKPLDAPRAAGQAGERYDGYAVARPGAPSDVQALIERVNAERRALYTQRAKEQGVPADAIGKIYAAEIAKSVPKGTWLLGEDGQWTQK
ncbi:YdbL family protein [Zavarzinia compransoris]|nr:YdbL family protein [Zavarzinia compransoris]TDP48304.1 uncharacterized protein YdbL (DUF1318 family) [Zavarzinia compransoris]